MTTLGAAETLQRARPQVFQMIRAEIDVQAFYRWAGSRGIISQSWIRYRLCDALHANRGLRKDGAEAFQVHHPRGSTPQIRSVVRVFNH